MGVINFVFIYTVSIMFYKDSVCFSMIFMSFNFLVIYIFSFIL